MFELESNTNRPTKTLTTMKTRILLEVAMLSAAGLALTGCATEHHTSAGAAPKVDHHANAGAVPKVTVPNGSSPASANAPHAPMNDTDAARSGWNHGNGSLWVLLETNAIITLDEPAQHDSREEFKGYSRVKFGWWRGGPGTFSVEGRRLDASAPPLRYLARPESYGAFGFLPSYLYFPSDGYWEITGRLDNKSLTFVVHAVKKSETAK